jgi:repressor LexA
MPRRKTEGLTTRETEVLQVIETAIRSTGVAPTYREIGKAVGMSSTCSPHVVVKHLIEKGYLKRDPYRYRGIKVTGQPDPKKLLAALQKLARKVADDPYLASLCFDEIQALKETGWSPR